MTILIKSGKFLIYLCVFIWELLKANMQVAYLVLSPRFRFKSAAIRYKTKVKTVPEMILLSNSITLTPGTLVMDAHLDKGELLVHVMSTESTEKIKKDIEEKLEKKVIWTLRH